MTSEERALNLMEWLNTDDEEYIATLDEIKDMFDQHAAEQREICANTLRDDLAGVFVQVNPVLINTLTKNCLNATGESDE